MRPPVLALLLLAVPAFADDPPAKPTTGTSAIGRAFQQLGEKLTSKSGVRINGMTLPSPHYLQHYPTYSPPDLPRALKPELAVPPEALKSSDLPASHKVKEDTGPLLGTWVRDVPGIRVTLKFTEKRLFATVQIASKPEGKGLVETATIKLDADYGVGPGGRVFGVVTGVDFAVSNWLLLGRAVNAEAVEAVLDELPFSFRARADDDTLTIAGLKAQSAGETDGLIVRLLGKFRRTDGASLPSIKPVKAEHLPSEFGPPHGADRVGSILGGLVGSTMGSPRTDPPRSEEAPKPREVPAVAQFMCVVEPSVQHLPDVTRNGKETAVLLGKAFLFGADSKPTEADGQLTVVMTDATPRPPGTPPKNTEVMNFDSDTLKKLLATDERLGQHYLFPIPWPSDWADVTQVTIQAQYKPSPELNWPTLYHPPLKVTVKAGKE